MPKTWSRYNYLFRDTKNRFLLYNSRSDSFAEIPENLAPVLQTGMANQTLPEGIEFLPLLVQLQAMKAIVDSIEDDDFFLKLKAKADRLNHKLKDLHFYVAPSLRCNFRCSYCYVGGHSAKRMSDETVEKFLTFIKKHPHCEKVSFCWIGGEPIMEIDRIVKIDESIKASGYQVEHHFYTNGSLLAEETIEKLKSLNLIGLTIVIDGMEETHNVRRTHANPKINSFECIVEGIERCLEISDIPIRARINLDKQNVNDYVPLYEFLKTRFGGRVLLQPIFVFDDEIHSICGSESEFAVEPKKQFEFILEQVRSGRYDVDLMHPLPLTCTMLNDNMFAVGADGEVYKCPLHINRDDRIVDYLDDRESANPELTSRFAAGVSPFDDQECMSCPLFPVCGGLCPDRRYPSRFENKTPRTCDHRKHLDLFLEAHYLQSKQRSQRSKVAIVQ